MSRFAYALPVLLIAAGASAASAASAVVETSTIDVPYLSGVEIDGRVDDWRGRGLRVGLLQWPGRTREAATHHALSGRHERGDKYGVTGTSGTSKT